MLYQNLRSNPNKDQSSDDLRFISENMSELFPERDSEKTKDKRDYSDKSNCEENIDRKKGK